ncbi:hypothetical protein OAO18_02040 [Francisellaceae bacterium]|nr:hypothetical protein [Francisellaceae bacterium]
MSVYKYIGCILLVISCMIGGGILALPLLVMQLGLIATAIIIVIFYILMTVSGLLTLESSIQLPEYRNHFTSLAKATAGSWGKYITLVVFAIAIYASLAAYISASPDLLLEGIDNFISVKLTSNELSFLFTFVLGIIIVLSMKYAERLNRFIMTVKLISLVLVILLLSNYITENKVGAYSVDFSVLPQDVLVVILAFCYQLLIPSLVNYIGRENGKPLKKVILISTSITCVIYLLWACAIAGFIHSIPGQEGSDVTNLSQLVKLLDEDSGSRYIPISIHTFLDVTLFASFIAVSIAFVDFWIDALNLDWHLKGRIIAGLIAFIPPWFVASYFKQIFLYALSISGYFGMIYALLLPAWAAYRFYNKYYANGSPYFMGNKSTRGFIVILCFVLMILLLAGILSFK